MYLIPTTKPVYGYMYNQYRVYITDRYKGVGAENFHFVKSNTDMIHTFFLVGSEWVYSASYLFS